MRVLYVADPLDGLNAKTDSTLALMEEAERLGHENYWAESSRLSLRASRAWVEAPARCVLDGGVWRQTPGPSEALRAFHLVWVRRDPPFDSEYLKMCWLLAIEEGAVRLVNRPSVLLKFHEKLLPLHGVATGKLKESDVMPTFLNARPAESTNGEAWVSKPFLGFGGQDITKHDRGVSKDRSRLWQPFREAIYTEGDRRILYWRGAVLGHFTRLPASGSFISNLARGGRAELRPLSSTQKAVVARLGRYLKSIQVDLAGADLIGTQLTEVNITSPTGLRALHDLTGSYPVRKIWRTLTSRSVPSRRR